MAEFVPLVPSFDNVNDDQPKEKDASHLLPTSEKEQKSKSVVEVDRQPRIDPPSNDHHQAQLYLQRFLAAFMLGVAGFFGGIGVHGAYGALRKNGTPASSQTFQRGPVEPVPVVQPVDPGENPESTAENSSVTPQKKRGKRKKGGGRKMH